MERGNVDGVSGTGDDRQWICQRCRNGRKGSESLEGNYRRVRTKLAGSSPITMTEMSKSELNRFLSLGNGN